MGGVNWYDGLLLDIDKVQSSLDGYHARIEELNNIPNQEYADKPFAKLFGFTRSGEIESCEQDYQASAKLLAALQKMADFVKKNRMDPKYTFDCSQTLSEGCDVFC